MHYDIYIKMEFYIEISNQTIFLSMKIIIHKNVILDFHVVFHKFYPILFNFQCQENILPYKILEAKNILKLDLNGKTDPYLTLKLGSQKVKETQKTKVMMNTLFPKWNQEFDFKVNDINDILIINMYNDDIKNDDRMMDELVYPVNTLIDEEPPIQKVKRLKLGSKDAGTLIFGAQATNI